MATMSTHRIASAIANHLKKNGLNAEIEHSRRSNSKYVYASIPEDHYWDHWDEMEKQSLKPDKMKTIRISDHLNPAMRFGRQSDSNDRAIETDYEIRTDQDNQKNWKDIAHATVSDFSPEMSFLRGKGQIPHKADGGDVDGITAYHGSPHDFDEFDTSKIGTGEGAQAFGHGLYFAQAEPTAIGYRDRLAHQGAIDLEQESHQRGIPLSREAQIELRRQAKSDADAATAAKRMQYASIEARPLPQEKLADLIDIYRKSTKGHMYEVHIDAHPHHMLDWDKPLSEQSEHVQTKLEQLAANDEKKYGYGNGLHYYFTDPDSYSGGNVHKYLAEQYGSEDAAKFLHGAGIKGIKYLDAGSRGDKAEPTHNYVVFDHKDVRVKRKYEQGGAVNGYEDGGVIPHDDIERDINLGKFLYQSKVRNGDGEHVVLYHITPKNFDEFKAGGDNPNLSGPGIWLSPNKHYLPAAHNVGGEGEYEEGTNVMPVYASIKSPLIIDTEEMRQWAKSAYDTGGEFPYYLRPEAKQKMIEDGYDGIFVSRGKGNVEYGVNGVGIGEQSHGQEEIIAFHPHQIKSAIGNNGNFDPNSPRINEKRGGAVNGYEDGGAVDGHYIGEHYQDGGEVDPPKKKVKAYKLFRTDPKKPGKLFPLFVDANTPVPIKKWVEAKAGDPGKDPTKVKSKLGDLAYRPGWHAGDLPVATHIGGKSSSDLKAPDYRPDNHVWAEIEMPNDVDWQSEANSRVQYTKAGKPKPATAHITDQVPLGGHYRYKTNPNMTGNWLIGGSMKVNRILKDDEVKAINDANGVADLPRLPRAPETKARGGPIATSGPIVKRALELLSKDRTGR